MANELTLLQFLILLGQSLKSGLNLSHDCLGT